MSGVSGGIFITRAKYKTSFDSQSKQSRFTYAFINAFIKHRRHNKLGEANYDIIVLFVMYISSREKMWRKDSNIKSITVIYSPH